MHPCLITGDNVAQEIISLCLISCQKSFTRGKTVCFLIYHQEARNPCFRHFSVTLITRNDSLGNPIRYSEYSAVFFLIIRWQCPSIISRIARIFFALVFARLHAWLSFCTHWLSAIGNFFVPVVDLDPWKCFFSELCS